MSPRVLFTMMAGAALVAGCRGETSRESPVVGIRNMYDQPKYDTQEQSEFFADGRTMRPLVEGVVARGQEVDPRISEGLLEDGTGYVLNLPQETVDRGGGMATMLKRGQERYNIYCSSCHGESGTGEGVVKQRAHAAGAAAFVPANLHDARLRHIPDGQLFATISHGKGNMAPYSYSVPVQDRWAIVAYVRALQLVDPKVALGAPPPEPATEPAVPASAMASASASAPPAGDASAPAVVPAASGDAAVPAAMPAAAGDAAAPAASDGSMQNLPPTKN